jgi:hypothetical protein
MKKTIILFSLFFVFALTLFAISASAQATTTTTINRFPLSFIIPACIENVAFEGDVQVVTHFTTTEGGGVTIKQNNTFRLAGVGQTTGANYLGRQSAQSQNHFDSIDFAPFTFTSVSHFFFSGQGSVPDLRANGSQHSTVNANGELTVFRDVFTIECN